MNAPIYARGDAIMTKGRNFHCVGMYTGQVTRDGNDQITQYRVQYGADGPFRWVAPRNMRHATAGEVLDAGLRGVGGLLVNGKEL